MFQSRNYLIYRNSGRRIVFIQNSFIFTPLHCLLVSMHVARGILCRLLIVNQFSVMCAFNNLYACVLDRFSDTIKVWAFRVTIFHKHAGAEMHSIQPMFFQGVHQPVNSPARAAPTCEKCYHLRIRIITLKAEFSFIESFEATHSGTGLRDQFTADNSYLFRFCFFGHLYTFRLSYSRREASVCLGALTTSTLKTSSPGFTRR
jgi:hypothetical protein